MPVAHAQGRDSLNAAEWSLQGPDRQLDLHIAWLTGSPTGFNLPGPKPKRVQQEWDGLSFRKVTEKKASLDSVRGHSRVARMRLARPYAIPCLQTHPRASQRRT